ncbi:MAG: TIGR03086 family metal-binding protein [Acidimicrobiales bacterium]
MSENLRRYQQAMFGFDAVARRMTPDQWDAPSKCEGWSNREVAGHVIWGVQRMAAGLGVGQPPAEASEAEVAGADPTATWVESRDRVMRALDRQGALATVIDSPFGPQPADELLRISTADVYTHTWDVGAAVGIDPALDPEVAEALYPMLAAFGDGLRGPGMMGPEVAVPGDASIVDQWLGLLGRRP